MGLSLPIAKIRNRKYLEVTLQVFSTFVVQYGLFVTFLPIATIAYVKLNCNMYFTAVFVMGGSVPLIYYFLSSKPEAKRTGFDDGQLSATVSQSSFVVTFSCSDFWICQLHANLA